MVCGEKCLKNTPVNIPGSCAHIEVGQKYINETKQQQYKIYTRGLSPLGVFTSLPCGPAITPNTPGFDVSHQQANLNFFVASQPKVGDGNCLPLLVRTVNVVNLPSSNEITYLRNLS